MSNNVVQIVQKLRSNEKLNDYLQFLFMQYEMSVDALRAFFLDLKLPPMRHLKEFICRVRQLEITEILIHLHFIENREVLKTNGPNLERFGIYFVHAPNDSFMGKYLPDNYDYIELGVKNEIYLYINNKNTVTGYSIKLKSGGKVYGLHSEDHPSEKYISLNILKFIGFDASEIMSIDINFNPFLSNSKISQLRTKHDITLKNKTVILSQGGSTGIGHNLQVDVRYSDILSYRIHRTMTLDVESCLKVAQNLRNSVEGIKIVLDLSTSNYAKNREVPILCKLITTNLLDEFNYIGLKNFFQAEQLIQKILTSSRNLRRFCYTGKTGKTFNHLKPLIKKLDNGIVQTLSYDCSLVIKD